MSKEGYLQTKIGKLNDNATKLEIKIKALDARRKSFDNLIEESNKILGKLKDIDSFEEKIDKKIEKSMKEKINLTLDLLNNKMMDYARDAIKEKRKDLTMLSANLEKYIIYLNDLNKKNVDGFKGIVEDLFWYHSLDAGLINNIMKDFYSTEKRNIVIEKVKKSAKVRTKKFEKEMKGKSLAYKF